MDVLGHENVAEDVEIVSQAELFESFEEDCAGVVVVEVWETLITTEGNEVVVAEAVIALESARHVWMIRELFLVRNEDLGGFGCWVPHSCAFFAHEWGVSGDVCGGTTPLMTIKPS
jgi:hypothetical protein